MASLKKKSARDLILAIDQGTTGSKAVLLNGKLKLIAEGYQEFPQIYPKPGWVEHDPSEIWKSVGSAVKKALRKAKIKATQIACIGITNQRETTLLWDRKTSEPIYNAIVWQDRRTADLCRDLKEAGEQRAVKRKTGLLLDPYFSATKIAWMLKKVTGARAKANKGQLCFGTVDSYLLYRLTGGVTHATDISNASRTLLLNLKKGVWDSSLLKLFKVPESLLPEVQPNDGVFGRTQGVGFLPDGIPIAGLIGDQQSALFGQACFKTGSAKCTYGTGSFLLLNTGTQPIFSKSGTLTTAAWQLGKKTHYALEGSAFIAGAIVQWLRDGLGIIKDSSEVEALARSVPDSGEVTLVPALTGLGAPHWKPEARGIITGLTRGSTHAHIARAALEGIAFQNADLLRAMENDLGKKVRVLKVDGGASNNNLLMQFQADLLRSQVVRPQITSTTALGAGLLAGLASKMFSSLKDIEKTWKEEKTFKPEMPLKESKVHLSRWEDAVRKA